MTEPVRFVAYAELRARFGIPWSKQHIGREEKAGRFPLRVQLSPKCVAWVEAEILAWIEARLPHRGALPIAGVSRGLAAGDQPSTKH